MNKKTILKNTTVISLGTNLSRLLGLLRDILIARFFGTGYAAGAFVVAFTLPNMLRDFIGEGAANAAFVPVLTEYKVKATKEEFWKTANNILILLLLCLIFVSIVGIVAAPFIVRVMAPGFIKAAGAIPITVRLTRIMFPYILFMGLTAYSMGILNTLNHFTAPAFSHGLLNVSLILSIIILCPRTGVMGLAVGVLLGGLLQVLVQIPVLYKKGFRLTKGINFSHPAVKKIGLLLAPRVVGTAVYQINVLADRILASLFWIVGTGGIPALYYSYRLIQYPLGIFSTALATAVLPVMSNHAVGRDMKLLKSTVSFSLRSVFFIMIPASVGLVVLGKPLIRILFERGVFNAYSSAITYHALLFYSIGLFAYGGIRILAVCFYSMNDTITPVKVAGCSLIVNIVFNLILMWPLKIGGLALATSIAATFNFVMLFLILERRLKGLEVKAICVSVAKIILAVIPMGLICYYLSEVLFNDIPTANTLLNISRLVLTVGVGIIVFISTALLLGVEEARKLLKWILRKD